MHNKKRSYHPNLDGPAEPIGLSMPPSVRTIETVQGWEAAKQAVAGYIQRWNESNGAGRMELEYGSLLRARDNEGSGEFVEARCENINEATSAAHEIYNVVVPW